MKRPDSRGSLVAAEGVTLSLPLPARASELNVEAVDLSMLPGARLVDHRSWQAGATHFEAACVAAPASRWLDGLDAVVLAGASALARKQLGLAVLRPGAVVEEGETWVQPFEGGSLDTISWRGQHRLGFSPDEVFVCTLACSAQAPACDDALAGVALTGALAPAPPPGAMASLLSQMAAYPRWTAASLAILVLAAIAWLLQRRPRPRW